MLTEFALLIVYLTRFMWIHIFVLQHCVVLGKSMQAVLRHVSSVQLGTTKWALMLLRVANALVNRQQYMRDLEMQADVLVRFSVFGCKDLVVINNESK